MQVDQPGVHPNGATGWVHVAVAARNLESTLDVYQNQLGLELLTRDIHQGAQRATLGVGKGTIALQAPDGEGLVQQIITEKGEGPYTLNLAVKNLEQTRVFLEQQGIKFTHKTEEVEKLVIDPNEISGVRINFVR